MLVMELVDGPDLRSRLAAGALDPRCVAALGQDLCGALVHAHARGVIHRDVKPANVLLADAGTGEVRAKLADFGIAVQPSGTRGDQVWTAGTAAYLSPEQVEGRPLSGATDVYSLGLVLLEALTARPTYGGSAAAAALARLNRDPDIPPEADGALGEVLRAMTRRSPAERPAASTALSAFRVIAERSGSSDALQLSPG
jgi:serine/threonine protein kinase